MTAETRNLLLLKIRRNLNLLCLLAGFASSGCGNSKTATSIATNPQSLPACGASTVVPNVSKEFLFATSIFSRRLVYVYQINPTTGSATPLPWSPISTYNLPQDGTPDATGQFLYFSSTAGPNSTNTTDTLESFALIGLPNSAPTQLSVQPSGSSEKLILDPQGRFIYTLDPYRDLMPPADGLTTILQAYSVGNGGSLQTSGSASVVPASFGSYYAYKSIGNLVLLSHGSPPAQPYGSQNGITVYQENCETGSTTFVAENSLPNESIFLNAPTGGDLVLGWNCGLNPPRSWIYKVNASTGKLLSYPNSPIQGLCGASFDRQNQYAAGLATDNPLYTNNPDTLVIYKLDSTSGLIETDRATLPQVNGGPQTASMPVFDATGNFIYMPTSGHLYVFSVDRVTGKLTVVPEVTQSPNESYYSLIVVSQH